ncbi:hypothetical protein SAMN06265221_14012 [Paracoccus laeviglucosivorans]|uniref:Uncharacterized protein n=1 Tax=Paracoccus laeviglucosivorans TaxID=1197861 RepID=A0A521FS63_9RHOB|nr:hypothetical protein SAMN06265221_14012 [Paracoccus laeviglucosivorans]
MSFWVGSVITLPGEIPTHFGCYRERIQICVNPAVAGAPASPQRFGAKGRLFLQRLEQFPQRPPRFRQRVLILTSQSCPALCVRNFDLFHLTP